MLVPVAYTKNFCQKRITMKHISNFLCNVIDPLLVFRFYFQATNDDLILQCCVKFEEKLHQTSTNSAIKTVLLSDDRNLRVKALARHMPTKALPDFCKWANITKP